MSDLELVSIIENQFIPVAIRNNTSNGTPNHQVLSDFNEPSWNNPVVRFLFVKEDNSTIDIIKRKDGVYSTKDVKKRCFEALEQYKKISK